MAGISDSSTRIICSELGADLTFAEMVSAKGLSYNSTKTKELISLDDRETSVGIQLFGHEPQVLGDQAKWVEQELGERLAYIDINMGCPARKIVSKGDGAALILNPTLACKIVESVKSSVGCHVTVKTRRGYYLENEKCVEFAKSLENAGADAICIHGRYATQMYRGSSDNGAIARVKEALCIPVIGNGDVTSVGAYVAMKQETGCDAVMIARAAMSHPQLFKQIKDYNLTGKFRENTPKEKMELAIEHVKLTEDLQMSKARDIRHFRRHAMAHVEGLKGARVARRKICEATRAEEFITIFRELIEFNER